MKSINLKDFVIEKGKANKGMMVSMPLIPKMEIYGFVIINKSHAIATELSEYLNIFTGLDDHIPYGRIPVCGDRLIYKISEKSKLQSNRIFYNVFTPEKDSLPLENLYIPDLFYSDIPLIKNSYLTAIGKKPYGYKGKVDIPNIKIIQDKYAYQFNENDFLFTSHSKIQGVGSEFMVICRRINQVTGDLIYEIYSAEDVYPIYNEKI